MLHIFNTLYTLNFIFITLHTITYFSCLPPIFISSWCQRGRGLVVFSLFFSLPKGTQPSGLFILLWQRGRSLVVFSFYFSHSFYIFNSFHCMLYHKLSTTHVITHASHPMLMLSLFNHHSIFTTQLSFHDHISINISQSYFTINMSYSHLNIIYLS
jgi:hypothetical protein